MLINDYLYSSIHSSKLPDDETKRLSLQTLELLAIENCEWVVSREGLLPLLIDICKSIEDDQICLLAAKLLLYYAETPTACATLLQSEGEQSGWGKQGTNPITLLV